MIQALEPNTAASSEKPDEISRHLDEAEEKAWRALARYKPMMFGYWCAIWVHLNRISGEKRPNPWRELVQAARQHLARKAHEPAQQKNGVS